MGGDVRHGLALSLDRALVAARDRPGQRRGRPELGQVVDRAAQQGHQQRACLMGLEAGARGDALRGRLEGDHEVRGDRRGGVIGRASLVVDLEGRHPQGSCERGGELERAGRGARDGAAGAGEGVQPITRPRREGLQRVQPERRHARGRQVAQRRGAAGVAHERSGSRRRPGHAGDLGVGHAEHDRRAAARNLAAAGRALDLEAGLAQGKTEGSADAPCADHAQADVGESVDSRVHTPAGPLQAVAAGQAKDRPSGPGSNLEPCSRQAQRSAARTLSSSIAKPPGAFSAHSTRAAPGWCSERAMPTPT